jgi:hypothetical protein
MWVQDPVEQPAGSSVKIIESQDMIACMKEGDGQSAFCGHARGESQTEGSIFKSCQPLFKSFPGGISCPAVLIALRWLIDFFPREGRRKVDGNNDVP